ncbi:engulfment and cell motility protein 3 [Bombina bombina]|uniref:engulfment and cell motility protein 3 n=1 Tax=Bombina bombina TaxID=8345 RepID=UPI00235A884A|nr:engulfment and cell motility protein 3 [Bombina bombina]XP_053558869.1 engulfment and cell motility protein 3 [Bombina bombina]XP_053558876.1 engulfment and cell motility protein 3 [Bombina bombina]
MEPAKNIVKIAIQMMGAYPQLIELNQSKPLTSVLKDVCDGWNISNSEQYALQYVDGHQGYITELNRMEIKNGSILRLTTSPDKEASSLCTGAQSNNQDVKSDSLKKLAQLSQDVTFAQEFISRDGLYILSRIVEQEKEMGEVMSYALKAIVELMEHGFVSWEAFSKAFIFKVVSFVTLNLMAVEITQLSLAILESVVQSNTNFGELVREGVTLDRLLILLQLPNQEMQIKVMALLVALLQTASDREREEMLEYLWKKNMRQFIHKHIIHGWPVLGDEMSHYLYVLQCLTLGLMEPRMRRFMDPNDSDQRKQLQDLRVSAFPNEVEDGGHMSSERRHSICAKEFRKLGFNNNGSPWQDLCLVPPGLLALDNMVYFSNRWPSAYSRFVLENSSREDKHACPFARSSIQLSLILCEILRIGEPVTETGQNFLTLFYAQDYFVQELFCICIQLLNKTWKEMRATQEDFDKVINVVKEQISRTLAHSYASLETFRTKIFSLNYSEILKLRQEERQNQDEVLSPPVMELRMQLKPELLNLIKQQRLHSLCEGTKFRKISSRRRQDKLWLCRLSPNHKVLHYGDIEDNVQNPSIDYLQEKIPVAEIKDVLTGKDCPHTKEKSSGKQNKEIMEHAFSIYYNVDSYLNFVAPSKHDFCVWVDGLNALLGRKMLSELMRNDLDILLNTELKLRLLDLENIPIPEQPPPIPPRPLTYNYCYEFTSAEA